MGKVTTIQELKQIISDLKSQNKTVVATNGCFDILHVGHVRYLDRAKALGDILVLGVNSDNSVRKLKGPERPINNENDRAEVMAALSSIDYVVIFEEDTFTNCLAEIKPDIYAKGGDYDLNNLPEAAVMKEIGGKIEFLPFIEGKSTTNIISKINS